MSTREHRRDGKTSFYGAMQLKDSTPCNGLQRNSYRTSTMSAAFVMKLLTGLK